MLTARRQDSSTVECLFIDCSSSACVFQSLADGIESLDGLMKSSVEKPKPGVIIVERGAVLKRQ